MKSDRLSLQDQPSRLSLMSAYHPLWDLAFRPLFILASILSAVSVLAWLGFLQGWSTIVQHQQINPITWHLHEMLFGFAATCAIGFLLTASQTWTKARSANGITLIALTLIWLAARVAVWQGALISAMVLQGTWWIGSVAILANLLIRNRSRRNYQFIPLLLLMAALNLCILWLEHINRTDLAIHLGRTAILLFGILVSIVAGRIIPLFTRNATKSTKIKSSHLLDIMVLVTSILGMLAFLFSGLTELPITPAYLMLAAGALHLYRLSGWDSLSTRSTPLLWSLHLTYLCLGLGLTLLGMSYFNGRIIFSDALHLIAVGTIGGMILSVMARVSLGHTGRTLKTKPSINLAFALILVAALTRGLFPALGWIDEGRLISALLWATSFSLFSFHYIPILTQARQSP